jgi:hypothetical protein
MITGECAYVDGVIADTYPSISLRINNMTAGRYIAFYTAEFSKE